MEFSSQEQYNQRKYMREKKMWKKTKGASNDKMEFRTEWPPIKVFI